MPSGYETRSPGRNTFAVAGPNPVQVSPSAQGNTNGVQIVGGNSQSGVVSGEAASPGVAGQLGGFFADILEPHIVARQKEEYVRGAVTQMSRQAGDEIHASKGGFSKIFGQSSFVEGAVNYTAHTAVNEWGLKTLDDIDNLKKLPPAELAKYVSASITELSTGDRYTDTIVQSAMLEASGPVVQAIAKAQYIWKQEKGAKSWIANMEAAAALYQQVGLAAASQSAASEDGGAAFMQATNNFKAAAMIPTGMNEETYTKSLGVMMKSLAQNGNGYAATALMHSGVLNVLSEADQVKAEDAYNRYGAKALSEAVLEDPAILARYMKLESMRNDPTGKTSMLMITGAAKDLNDYVKRKTGFDLPLLDDKDVVGYGKSILQAIHEQDMRTEARNNALNDRLQQRAWDQQDRQEELEQKAAAASMAYASGNIRQALAAKIGDEGSYNTLANNDFVKGNYAPLLTAYRNSNWVSSLVQNTAQAGISAAIGSEYSPAVDAAHKQWLALRDTNPALASAIYGKYDLPLTNYDKLRGGGISPQEAYDSAFMNPAHYRSAQMPVERRKEAGALLSAVINGEQPWSVVVTLPFQRTAMNAVTKKVIGDTLWDDFAVRSGNSSLPSKVISAQVLEQAVRSGRIERYGAFGWRNQTNTTPLGTMLGLQTHEADTVVTSAIDAKLKAAGFSDGASGDNISVMRIKGPDGKPSLYVQAYDGREAHPAAPVITFDQLRAAAAKLKQPHPASKPASMPKQYNNVDAYRRIPGESGAARLARINREVAAGASPTRRPASR